MLSGTNIFKDPITWDVDENVGDVEGCEGDVEFVAQS